MMLMQKKKKGVYFIVLWEFVLIPLMYEIISWQWYSTLDDNTSIFWRFKCDIHSGITCQSGFKQNIKWCGSDMFSNLRWNSLLHWTLPKYPSQVWVQSAQDQSTFYSRTNDDALYQRLSKIPWLSPPSPPKSLNRL
jgi:hypothetical protein